MAAAEASSTTTSNSVTFEITVYDQDPGYVMTDDDLQNLGSFVLEVADDERLRRDNWDKWAKQQDKKLADFINSD